MGLRKRSFFTIKKRYNLSVSLFNLASMIVILLVMF